MTSKFKNISNTLTKLYAKACGCSAVEMATPPIDGDKLDAIVNRIIRLIHTGKLRGKVPADLSLIVANALHETVLLTFPMETKEYDAPENARTAAMRSSIYAFAAAKTYSAIKAMTDKLFDADGQVKRFSDFKRDALEVHETYNVNWLKSEYDHAVASMQMADRWLTYERQADAMPLLTYLTAGDDRVRQAHAELDHVTLPIQAPSWKTHYPPNGWGCRCDAAQSNDESLMTSEARERELLGTVKLDPMFSTNVGKTGIIFKGDHPYFTDVDGKVTELDAERDYGMRTIDSILADRSKLPQAQEPATDLDSWWNQLKARRGFGSDNVTLVDRNANKLLLKPGAVTDKAIAANIENVVAKANEVWATEATTTYLRYYKESVMAVTVSRAELEVLTASTSTIKGASKAFTNSRQGILMYR